MSIPIKNIYYLLCYAWDKLEEGKHVDVSSDDYDEAIDLLSRVLVNGCTQLFKRGIDKDYLKVNEEYIGIKGKVDFNSSLRKNLFKKGRAVCEFDEFDANTLHNQILKYTLKRVLKIKTLNTKIANEVRSCLRRFPNVEEIELRLSHFSMVKIHRNNSFYFFLLKICRLVYENTVLDEKSGQYSFKEFIGNEKEMARLFEAFIRNFYKREQNKFKIRREDIYWDAIALGESSKSYLPKMQTDTTLESENRKIIVETKYSENALKSRYDAEKFSSNNLYQLYSYLRNIETKTDHPLNVICEGVLLYPTVDYSLNESYQIGAHKFVIRTVNLGTDWKNIYKELMSIIN